MLEMVKVKIGMNYCANYSQGFNGLVDQFHLQIAKVDSR